MDGERYQRFAFVLCWSPFRFSCSYFNNFHSPRTETRFFLSIWTTFTENTFSNQSQIMKRNILIAKQTYLSQDDCIHQKKKHFIRERTHSSGSAHIHQWVHTFISGSTHSIPSTHIHQGAHAFIRERTHSSVSAYIYQWVHAFNTEHTHSSGSARIHQGAHTFIGNAHIHHKTYTFIMRLTHSSRNALIHHETHTFITKRTHSSSKWIHIHWFALYTFINMRCAHSSICVVHVHQILHAHVNQKNYCITSFVTKDMLCYFVWGMDFNLVSKSHIKPRLNQSFIRVRTHSSRAIWHIHQFSRKHIHQGEHTFIGHCTNLWSLLLTLLQGRVDPEDVV